MTHDQALDWFDHRADGLQRAGVKIRMFDALRPRTADLQAGDDASRAAIVAAEMVKAVEAEKSGEKLP